MSRDPRAAVTAISYALPSSSLSNEELARLHPTWSVEKIEAKVGIRNRYLAGPTQTSADLAVEAGQRLFAEGACSPDQIDFLLLCTQTPDHFLPTTACMVQDRLGLPTSVGALDFNLGCSGYVYGLSLAKGLIETGQASRLLLITAETYTKLIHPEDRSVRTIFGDAAAATLIEATTTAEQPPIGPFVFGTDGRGAPNLIVPAGGLRTPKGPTTGVVEEDEEGNRRSAEHLYMNGPEIFGFTLRAVPDAVKRVLERAQMTLDDVDLVVPHQANKFMLEHLRRRMKIPEDKLLLAMENVGNTVSCTIPIALRLAADEGRLKPNDRLLLVGFGVGYSWGATLLRWGTA